MGELVTGAAVGALLAEVIIHVKEAIDTFRMFGPRLQHICSALTQMEPLVKQMMGLDKQLDIPNDELKPIHNIVQDCRILIKKCLKVKQWNLVSLLSLSRMLLAMDNRLVRFCQVDLQLIMARDTKAGVLKAEQNNAINQTEEYRLKGTASSVVAGALVGALVAELLSLKQAIQTSHLEMVLESLKPQIDQEMDTFNNSQLEELRPIHGLLKAGLGLINKCRMLRQKYQFCDKLQQFYSVKLLNLENGILRLCKVDLVGLLFGNNVQINTKDVSQLMDEMDSLSVLLEPKHKTTITFKACEVPPCPDFLVGYDFLFNYIKAHLLTGEEPVIVITGGGGYGKTTLVTKICHDEQVTGKYKDIIFVVASESISLMEVMQQIRNHLTGVEISEPDTLTEDDAVQLLQQLLAERAKENPILLVLDDFWYDGLEKFVNKDIPNYRVLVTSRSELPGFGSSHQLKGLEREDAVKLLRHEATPWNDRHSAPIDYVILDEMAKRCKGSPLALTKVGRSLCGKHKSAWVAKLKEWSDGVSLFGMLDDQLNSILTSLMKSLKGLDGNEELERFKKCFLDLGSFPEGHRICVAALVDMWSALYGIDANGEDAIAAIIELSARNLVNLDTTGEDISLGYGYYNNMHVQVHDLRRELIIHLNSEAGMPIEERERLNLNIRKNNLPKWLLKEQKQPFKARLVSICTDEYFSSPWPDMELPAAEVLVLNFRTKQNYYTLPSFIKKMVNLKTLIVTNNGQLPVKLSNSHLIASNLLNLKRIRLERIKIDSSSRAMTNDFCLDNLEKISAFLCDISEDIQTTCNLQINKVFPKLEEIDISYCRSLKTLPNGICNRKKTLKKINITDCHNLSKLPQKIGNLVELEVLRLTNCTNLKMLPASIVHLKNLSFLDISNCVNIDRLPTRIEKLYQLKELRLSCCVKLSSLPSSITELKQLEYLIIDEEQLHGFKRFFKDSHKLQLKVANYTT